jgi:hypothetical protein
MIREIAQYVENETTFTIGENLFVGFRPQQAPDGCITVMEPSGEAVNFYRTDEIQKPVQFLTRDHSYDVAKSAALIIRGLFHGQCGFTLPVLTSGEAYLVNVAEVLSGPFPLSQDERGRHSFSINILFRVQSAPTSV